MATVRVKYEPGSLVVDRFRVVSEIARGGLGVVYLATDQSTASPVALKLSHAATDLALRKILCEASFHERVSHPGIVRLVAAGALPDGGGFIATEYVEGETLEARLARERLTVQQALSIGADIADAVQALHDASLVHRDLKPSNVLLQVDQQESVGSRVKLIDLGILKELGLHNASDRPATPVGFVSGTALYMAPEQLAGRPQTVATDIYAMGILIVELLTGSPPMKHLPIETSVIDAKSSSVVFIGPFVVQRLTHDCEIPDCIEMPEPVRALLTSMLRMDPNARPTSAAFVAQTLRAAAQLANGFQNPPARRLVASDRA